jgi:hypothetical protein
MNGAFGSVAFNRRQAGKKFPFEALYGGGALGFTNQLLQAV